MLGSLSDNICDDIIVLLYHFELLISGLLVASIIALVILCFQVWVYVLCLFSYPSLDKTKINNNKWTT